MNSWECCITAHVTPTLLRILDPCDGGTTGKKRRKRSGGLQITGTRHRTVASAWGRAVLSAEGEAYRAVPIADFCRGVINDPCSCAPGLPGTRPSRLSRARYALCLYVSYPGADPGGSLKRELPIPVLGLHLTSGPLPLRYSSTSYDAYKANNITTFYESIHTRLGGRGIADSLLPLSGVRHLSPRVLSCIHHQRSLYSVGCQPEWISGSEPNRIILSPVLSNPARSFRRVIGIIMHENHTEG